MLDFELTDEQKEIVESNENLIIEARAGTGKTTTLMLYADKHKDKSKLYIAFNTSVKEDAIIKFEKANIKCNISTIHGLAFYKIVIQKKYPFYNKNDEKDGKKLPECKIHDLLKFFELDNSFYKIIYYAEKKFLYFCDSDINDINDITIVDTLSTEKAKDFYLDNEEAIDRYAYLIWHNMNDKKIYVNNSFYLKKYQLSKPVLRYDIIMVDECLPYDSKILLADGSTIPIGEIVDKKLNVEVITYNEETKKQEINRIVGHQSNTSHNKLRRIIFDDRILECTFNHKIYVSGYLNNENGFFEYVFFPKEDRWIEASELKENYYCQMNDGNYKLIEKIENVRFKEAYTYDITVENNHNFYANGVLVHNCQDLNPVMVDIILQQSGRKIMVGDTHQAIYNWRGAINTIKLLPYKKKCLTSSFRFHQQIADLGLKVLSYKQDKEEDFEVLNLKLIGKGNNDGNITNTAILSRNNINLLYTIMATYEDYSSIYIEGGLASLTKNRFDLVDIYYLYINKKDKIKNYHVLNFNSFVDMLEYYDELDELFVRYSQYLFDKLEKEEIDFIPTLENIKLKVTSNQEDADIIFSTIHKAKGKEWDHVKIISSSYSDEGFPHTLPTKTKNRRVQKQIKKYMKMIEGDIFHGLNPKLILEELDNLNKKLYREFTPKELEKIKIEWCEELNLYYVAITRAKKKISHDIEWLGQTT